MAEISSDSLPDLAVLIRRDGVILAHLGGRTVGELIPPPDAAPARLEAVWPEAAAVCIKQAVRRCIAQRQTVETRFECSDMRYEVRAFAQGPDRALCVIRVAAGEASGGLACDSIGVAARRSASCSASQPSGRSSPSAEGSALSDDIVRPHFDRRGFLARFQDTLSQSAIRERPAALALVYLDGLTEIARVVDAKIADQVLSGAILRLPEEARLAPSAVQLPDAEATWYLGQLSAELLAIVVESSDRDMIERCVAKVCASLREPVQIGDASFHLTPYSGVSILGQDGSSPSSLLDKARSAAAEARRANSDRIHFFTDTLKLRSLARLDAAREIREAIAGREIRLRYLGRHDLDDRSGWSPRSGTCDGITRCAETSRRPNSWAWRKRRGSPRCSPARCSTAWARISRRSAPELPPDARLSFGPLRHHLLQDDFVDDIARVLAEGALPASRLEIRISERTFAAMNLSVYQAPARARCADRDR